MAHELHNSEEFKIIFAGLDNAGKTSFLIALRQKYNFYERVKKLKPTINIEYSSFNFLNLYCINLWDMGGQERFRKIYTNNPVYFTDTNYLYYLIDIQDELRFEESIQYLADLLDIFRSLEYSNEIIICFHKYDPKFKNSKDFVDRIEMIKMGKNILTPEEKKIGRMRTVDGFDFDEIAKILGYDRTYIDEVFRSISEKLTLSGAVPKLYWGKFLPELGLLGQEKKSKKTNLTAMELKAIVLTRKEKHQNLIKYLHSYGNNDISMPGFYDDSTFRSLGYSNKPELMDYMNLLVFLDILEEKGNNYRLTQFGINHLQKTLMDLSK